MIKNLLDSQPIISFVWKLLLNILQNIILALTFQGYFQFRPYILVAINLIIAINSLEN